MKKNSLLENGAEIVSLFCRLYMNTKKELPIRASHMGLLILTVKSETPVTPLAAAQFFKVRKPMITAMANSLIEKGYLEKQPSQKDRRSYLLIPTSTAVRLVEETYHAYFGIMDTLYLEMGPENYQQLLTLLAKANNILEKERNENG